jgi:hypothetical protein
MAPDVHDLVKHADYLKGLLFLQIENPMALDMQRAVARANMS